MNQNLIGLDIGTGSVKVATSTKTFKFPSVVARGKDMNLESFASSSTTTADITNAVKAVFVGQQAVKLEPVKSMVLRTPVYRGAPTSMADYVELIRYALDEAIKQHKDPVNRSMKYSDLVIVAGIPFNAKGHVDAIRETVMKTFAPKYFGLMFQAKATLDYEGIIDGIVCHIGHGTTEIMAVVHGNIAHGQTVMHGVGDITSVLSSNKTGYTDESMFSKNSDVLAEKRRILAVNISDSLEKVVIDYTSLPVICAGGGALVPKLVSEIKNDTIRSITVAKNPVFSNALGMLKKAGKKCV